MSRGMQPLLQRFAARFASAWLLGVVPSMPSYPLTNPPVREPPAIRSTVLVSSFTVAKCSGITADGLTTDWPVMSFSMTTVGPPDVSQGWLCLRPVTSMDPSGTQDTLAVYIAVGNAPFSPSDSVILVFDINRDQTLGNEDRGVWFSRGGSATRIDGARTLHGLSVGPLATRTNTTSNCVAATRVCIYELPAIANGWRIEAKLVPLDFGLNNFAETVGALLVASTGTSPSISSWPFGAVDPSSWASLYLETPHYRSCLPDVVNTPDTYLLPPVIDGVVTGDNGWTSAWRYVFNNGTPSPDVIVQEIRDAADLYLSFEVNNQGSVGDLITIAFDPHTTTPGDEWHLGIKPFETTGIKTEHWTAALPGTVDDPLVEVKTSSVGPPWFVEVKIPRALVGLQATGDFGFYFNVHPTTTLGMTGEFQWPTEPSAWMGPTEYVLPDPANWGKSTLSSVRCNGVFIDRSDIAVNGGSLIDRHATNVFTAMTHNESQDGNGILIDASGISATFKIARFGLPNMWSTVREDLPTTHNPTLPQTIPANQVVDLTFNWTLNTPEQADYPPDAHQCILVELNASGASGTMTTFANKSAWTNMDFGSASRFVSQPVIDGRGYGLPPGGQPAHVFELMTEQTETTFTQPPRERSAESERKWKPFSQLTYLVHGCRLSGRQILIGKRKYDVCERVGSFGYVIRHEGTKPPVWRVALAGIGLSKPAAETGNLLRLSVPAEKEVSLHIVIKAKGGGVAWWFWLILVLLPVLILALAFKRTVGRP